MELGFHVTLFCDATAAFSHDHMHAAHQLNGPTFAHAILSAAELLVALPPASRESRLDPITPAQPRRRDRDLMVLVSSNPMKAKAPPPQRAGQVASEIVVYSTFRPGALPVELTLVATRVAHQPHRSSTSLALVRRARFEDRSAWRAQ